MTIGIIVQARLGSTRYPRKVILPFYNGKSILELILEKLKKINVSIVVATSKDALNDEIEDLCHGLNVAVFRGDEEDVLSRFVSIMEQQNWSHCIRICADNPFIDVDGVEVLLQEALKTNSFDYLSYFVDDTPVIKTHWGLWGEVASLRALKQANEVNDPFYHEHVTNYIYEHPSMFIIKRMSVPSYVKRYNQIRLTVDTKEDFTIAQGLYSDSISTETLLEKIEKDLELKNRMRRNIEQNSK